MRSSFHLYLLSHGASEDFFFNFHIDRNSTVLYLAEGKEKCLELLEKILVSRNKKQSWFIHFSREHFDPEKDKFCSSLEQRRKC